MNTLRNFTLFVMLLCSSANFAFGQSTPRSITAINNHYDPVLTKKVLSGELPATVLLDGKYPNRMSAISDDKVLQFADCTASIRVNFVDIPSNPGGSWGIGIVMLDASNNPIGTPITMGDCPACNPYFTVGGTGSFTVPMGGARYDIFFIPDGGNDPALDSYAKVTEFPPCGTGPATPPLFYGDDIYGHYFVDFHQFGTELTCVCCDLPDVQICCKEGYFCLCDVNGVKISDSPLFAFPHGYEITWASPSIYAGSHGECFSSPFPVNGTPMQFSIKGPDCTRDYSIPFGCGSTTDPCDLPDVFLCCHLEKGYVCLCDVNGVQLSQSPLFANTAILWNAPSQYAGYTGECLSKDHSPGPLPPVGTPLVFTVQRGNCFKEYHLTYNCNQFKEYTEDRGSEGQGQASSLFASADYSLFPNPASASNTAIASNNTAMDVDLQVIGLDGKVFFSGIIPSNGSENLDLSNCKNGFYILKFTDKNGAVKAIKLIVSK